MIKLSESDQSWLRNNSHKLPSMNSGSKIGNKRINYIGNIQDVIRTSDNQQKYNKSVKNNPRMGSDVYVREWFEITRVLITHSKLSGCPKTPSQQWIRHTPIKTAHVRVLSA